MKTLKIKENGNIPFPWQNDITRIVNICEKRGLRISEEDAKRAWELHSDSMCASWLILPYMDDEVFMNVMTHCFVREEL